MILTSEKLGEIVRKQIQSSFEVEIVSYLFIWKRSVFIPILKKGNAKEWSNYHTIALISHTSKVMQSCHRPKKSLAFMHARSLRQCPTLCNPVDCGLSGFSIREGVLKARTDQYWLPYPSRTLYFLLLQPPTPMRTPAT